MKETIKKIIIDWQEANIPALIERDYSFDKDFSQILAIIGPRRAGKTFCRAIQGTAKALGRGPPGRPAQATQPNLAANARRDGPRIARGSRRTAPFA